MQIDEELRHKIGLALNEATLLGVEFDKEKDLVACSFSLVAMDKDGNVPKNNRLLFIFNPVGRFVASLCNIQPLSPINSKSNKSESYSRKK